MKRSAISVVLLCIFVCITAAAQDKTAKAPAKSKAAPIDCSGVTDATLAASVKSRLSQTPSLKDATIEVAASNGTVTLTGSLGKGQLKGVATNQAKRVACVQKVVNQITVPKSEASKSKNANRSQ
ncbi:MAG: BON domain-containing protein [Blastocatellia bacterium]